MSFDYSKLKGRIVEKFGNQIMFAKAMGCSERTLSLKLNNKVPWKQSEMYKAISLLDIADKEVQEYFFTIKVPDIFCKKRKSFLMKQESIC